MKTCFKCKAEKPPDDFYEHLGMAGGRLGKCKDCTKADVRENRKKRAGYYREQDRSRGSRSTPEYQRSHRAEHPEQNRAQIKAQRGVALAEECEICSSDSHVVRHHHDYGRPIDVWMLCSA